LKTIHVERTFDWELVRRAIKKRELGTNSSLSLKHLKASKTIRARRKTWKRINDLVEPVINVLAKARREGARTPVSGADKDWIIGDGEVT